MLAGLFFPLYGIGKQIRNAFWFGFIRFCFHEMSGERCGGRNICEKRHRRRTSANVGLWGNGCEALCYLLCKGPTFFSGNDIMRYEGSLFVEDVSAEATVPQKSVFGKKMTMR